MNYEVNNSCFYRTTTYISFTFCWRKSSPNPISRLGAQTSFGTFPPNTPARHPPPGITPDLPALLLVYAE